MAEQDRHASIMGAREWQRDSARPADDRLGWTWGCSGQVECHDGSLAKADHGGPFAAHVSPCALAFDHRFDAG